MADGDNEEILEEQIPAEGIDQVVDDIVPEPTEGDEVEGGVGGFGSFAVPADAVPGIERNKVGDSVRLMVEANISDRDDEGITTFDIINASLEGSAEEEVPPTSPIGAGLTAGEEAQEEIAEEAEELI